MTQPLPLSTSVFSYYLPETRQVIDQVITDYPHATFLKSIKPGLDDFHLPVLTKFLDQFSAFLPKLPTFPHRYVTSGSSEAIFHTLVWIKTYHPDLPLYQLEGEYEGYSGFGQNLGLAFRNLPLDSDFSRLKPGYFFISNPSACDGNLLPPNTIPDILSAGHRLALDCAYLGMTPPVTLDIGHPNLTHIFTSMSKPYGLFYHRLGFTFTRSPMPTLEVNKWFKNILSLLIADRLLDNYPFSQIQAKYASLQRQIVTDLNKKHQLHLIPSDTFLLAHTDKSDLTPDQAADLEPFNRFGSTYRFALTQAFINHQPKTLNN